MKVITNDERSTKSRKMVLELLVTDQPDRETSHDPDSHFWNVASSVDVAKSRFDKREKTIVPCEDASHVAMSVNLSLIHI